MNYSNIRPVTHFYVLRSFKKACVLFALLICLQPMLLSAESVDSSIKFAEELSNVFEHVGKTIRPSVVNISAVQNVRPSSNTQRNTTPPPNMGPFGDLFEEFFNNPQRRKKRSQGLGTGVIVDKEGLILTNNHVIEGADEITVRLFDKRSLDAEVVGADPKTDLAVIRVKADNLVPASLGNSDSLKIGEWVIASGNPFGLDNTITAGIVSAKGRANMGIVDYEDFIQTDAAINPGNSGGPLVNLRGEVVGINSAIFSRSGGYMGIGFAIPINMARNIMGALIDKGRVVRGWLGVLIQNLDKDLAGSFGYESTKGALVGESSSDSPAGKSGIKAGDIITTYDGKLVKDVNHLRNLVAATTPNSSVKVKIFRDGRYKTLNVKIGELETKQPIPVTKEESTFELGITLKDLTPKLSERLGVEIDEGVVITAVEPGSLAEKSGLQVRDIIIKVDNTEIDQVTDFRKALKKKSLRKDIRLVVKTGEFQRFVFLKSKE